jgi:L-aspartate oxidase
LRDDRGERFVYELAPRDVVSRAMAERMAQTGVDHLWLDATALENFDRRFPTVAASLAVAGLDPAVDWLPIAPAAHYISGGVLTDLDGASAMPGLWAAGEASCTGVHGANRLASNSLLEGMVFGARVAEALVSDRSGPEPTGVMEAVLRGDASGVEVPCTWVGDRSEPAGVESRAIDRGGLEDTVKLRALVQRSMTEGAGVSRTAASLDSASRSVSEVARGLAGVAVDRSTAELANLCTVSSALLVAAELREETRGAHSRLEFPEARREWKRRLVHGVLA